MIDSAAIINNVAQTIVIICPPFFVGVANCYDFY